jgi:hypothetical protein
MKTIKELYTEKLNIDIIYNILTYTDDCTIKRIKDRIIIYDPIYKIILKQLNKLCDNTDQNSVKSWRYYNHFCMKKIYKKINYRDFHLLLRQLTFEEIIRFIDIETVNMLHHLSLSYYQTLNYIYKTEYPTINNDQKRLVYGLFWDYCKFYFITYKGLNINENHFLL